MKLSYFALSNDHYCISLLSMKVGLDFTPRFISKEEDKDIQREVFSRQVVSRYLHYPFLPTFHSKLDEIWE